MSRVRARKSVGWMLAVGCMILSPVLHAAGEDPPDTKSPPESRFRSSEDGWLDVSGFLDRPYGFFPLLVPITEPAVGYGVAGGLAFIKKDPGENQAGFGRPDVTMVGGLATQNDTWSAFAGDLRHWHGDRFETFVGLLKGSINLDFYGVGDNDDLRDDPLSYNLAPLGGIVRGKYRLGSSRVWAGLTYVLADMGVEFRETDALPELAELEDASRIGGIMPALTFDSRDNWFTPNRGAFFEGTVGLYDESFGGDTSFQRVGLIWIQYWPVRPALTVGLRGRSQFSFGDTPFYMRPFVALRGVAMLRYQGEEVADVETEARWQFYKRFSVVGFAGAGVAWNDFESLDNTQTVLTGGTGFRYEIARRYGLHTGLDVAFGPDNPVIYVVFGSAWLRP